MPNAKSTAMVAYEMNVLLSRTASPYRSLELVRRCANMVVGSGGVVKQVQNHGIRPLGYKIRKNNETHTDAHYISLHADMNPRVRRPPRPAASTRLSDAAAVCSAPGGE